MTGAELPSIFGSADLTPVVLLLSLLTAIGLGAAHALTPGHGKTLMAAYLVGSRGTALHAVGLGLSVTLSHTIGILALAAVVIGAQGVLAPDVVVRTAPIVAAISIVVIGGWMLDQRGPAAAIGGGRVGRGARATTTTTPQDARPRAPARPRPSARARARSRAITSTAASATRTCRRPARPSPGGACSSSASRAG